MIANFLQNEKKKHTHTQIKKKNCFCFDRLIGAMWIMYVGTEIRSISHKFLLMHFSFLESTKSEIGFSA